MNITLKDDFKESVKIPSPSIIVHPVTKGVLDYHARPQALGIFNMKKKKRYILHICTHLVFFISGVFSRQKAGS